MITADPLDIIVVDDNYQVRHHLKENLEFKKQFSVRLARSSNIASKLLAESNPIFAASCDIRLSENDLGNTLGLDIIRQVRQRFPQAYIEAVTGHPQYASGAKDAGADAVVIKGAPEAGNPTARIARGILKKYMDKLSQQIALSPREVKDLEWFTDQEGIEYFSVLIRSLDVVVQNIRELRVSLSDQPTEHEILLLNTASRHLLITSLQTLDTVKGFDHSPQALFNLIQKLLMPKSPQEIYTSKHRILGTEIESSPLFKIAEVITLHDWLGTAILLVFSDIQFAPLEISDMIRKLQADNVPIKNLPDIIARLQATGLLETRANYIELTRQGENLARHLVFLSENSNS